ncbi:MAG: FAD-dependent oxidoreductase [Alphaproteobacteria bacterium]
MATALPSETQVVIIGGGAMGCSLAYHLTKLGWSDVVLLERKQLTCGTTWHAAGLVGQLRATQNLTKLAQYTAELFAGLEAETGQSTGFKQNGSLAIATNSERFEELKRGASMAKVFGLDVDVLTPSDIKSMHPLTNTDDLVGGVFLPKDGQTNPIDVTMAMAKGARMGGATIIENVKVTDIHKANGKVTGVSTDQGDIKADFVVNCAGLWARDVGLMAGVSVPLHACEHYYVLTDPIDGLPGNLPVLRDQGGCAYYKEDAGKILLGAFEPNAIPMDMSAITDDFSFDELPGDMDHFMPVLEGAMERLPILQEAGIRKFFCGPESFTSDDRYHMGEAPELKNFFVAAGFNSIGIQSSGGVGKVLAEWIVNGHPPMDLADMDIRRNMPFQNNIRYLRERVTETLGLLYDMHWPYRQYATSRGVRTSPLHEKLTELGACFGETAGWERANWFAPEGVKPEYEYSYKRQNWFDYAAAEHKAVREGVAFFDITSFSEFLVQGPDSEAVLQRICANDVAVEPGNLVYTQWLNERSGIEADLTVARLAEDQYMIVTAGGAATRDLHWLKSHIPDDARCTVTDMTSASAIMSVMGPKSRDLLSKITTVDLSNEAFPFGTWQTVDLGYAYGRAQRISYVGELGWELYVPTEFARSVFDTLLEAGSDYGLKMAGMHVLDSCRMEKAFRHWGHDITDEDTILEAGLGFAAKPNKNADFIGRDAMLRQKDEGKLTKRLVQFKLTDPEPLLYHNEPVLRDGKIIGHLTSGNYGHHLGGAVGLGYIHCEDGVTPDFVNSGTFEIEVACERFPAEASLRPMYDPKSERMKA